MGCLRAAFMRSLSPVPYRLLYRPAVPRNGQNPRGNQKSGGCLIFPNFRQSSGAKISAPRPLIKKPKKRKLVRLASSLKRAPLKPRGRGHCGDSSLMGGAHQNDITSLAEKGGGGCEGRLRAVTASGSGLWPLALSR